MLIGPGPDCKIFWVNDDGLVKAAGLSALENRFSQI